MIKKKRFKFNVNFEVEELSSVPFVSGVLFTKIRLLDGGNFTALSPREEVKEHRVKWNSKTEFTCKITAAASTGVLEPCICRVSVRKEVKGGKTYQKLGFADINLSEYAGSGKTSRRFLLEGYDSKRRQDNSILKVNIAMSLTFGDPLFKVPEAASRNLAVQQVLDLQPENKGGSDDMSEDSMGSSGFGSLPRKDRTSLVKSENSASNPDVKVTSDGDQAVGGLGVASAGSSELIAPGVGSAGLQPNHTRNESSTSQQSKASGYSSSCSHSRQSSTSSTPLGHTRSYQALNESPSTGSARSDKFGSINRQHRKLESQVTTERRVDQTRVDPDEVVDELMIDFRIDESAETSGLQLFVAKDGTTALSSQQVRNTAMGKGKFEQVVIKDS